jgi:hypothetical protein
MPPDPRVTRALLIAAAAGFSTVENLGYVMGPLVAYGLRAFGARPGSNDPVNESTLGDKALLSVGRVLLSLPLHCICALLTAIATVKRDREMRAYVAWAQTRAHLARIGQAAPASAAPRVRPWPLVLLPAILLHGAYDFVLMLFAALTLTGSVDADSAWGVVATVVMALGFVVAGAVVAVRGWRLIMRDEATHAAAAEEAARAVAAAEARRREREEGAGAAGAHRLSVGDELGLPRDAPARQALLGGDGSGGGGGGGAGEVDAALLLGHP